MILTSWEGGRGGGHESQTLGMSDWKGPLVSSNSHSCHLVVPMGKCRLKEFLILSRSLEVQFFAQGHPARSESSLLFSIRHFCQAVILWSASCSSTYNWSSLLRARASPIPHPLSNHSPIF